MQSISIQEDLNVERTTSGKCDHPRLQRMRQQMPVANRWAYFDHAAVAPLSGPAQQVIVDWSREAAEEGDTAWSGWNRRVEQTRDTAAAMINADADEVALVPNTTAGISLVAEGFPWREGDNVVVPAGEFPSNLYPWMNLAERGVEARLVPMEGAGIDLDRLADACDERTRIIAISWVGYANGYRIDVDEVTKLAHDRGMLLFLDAIQGLGIFSLDVKKTAVDFWPPTVTSGCSAPKELACFICAANISICCGRWASAGTASRPRTILATSN